VRELCRRSEKWGRIKIQENDSSGAAQYQDEILLCPFFRNTPTVLNLANIVYTPLNFTPTFVPSGLPSGSRPENFLGFCFMTRCWNASKWAIPADQDQKISSSTTRWFPRDRWAANIAFNSIDFSVAHTKIDPEMQQFQADLL
jgi:hypothetical protein